MNGLIWAGTKLGLPEEIDFLGIPFYIYDYELFEFAVYKANSCFSSLVAYCQKSFIIPFFFILSYGLPLFSVVRRLEGGWGIKR